jgi:putative ABC transport system substrate-binding protein
MRRRDFLGVLTSTAFLNPAEAQGGSARVGVLADAHLVVEAFTSELRALAREGRQIDIDLRLTGGKADRYASLARELIEQKPSVIFVYGTQALTALQTATGSVPVVAVVGDVGAALASESLRRPTNNVTGLTTLANQTSAITAGVLKGVGACRLTPRGAHKSRQPSQF